jgi:hypothetical protein
MQGKSKTSCKVTLNPFSQVMVSAHISFHNVPGGAAVQRTRDGRWLRSGLHNLYSRNLALVHDKAIHTILVVILNLKSYIET